VVHPSDSPRATPVQSGDAFRNSIPRILRWISAFLRAAVIAALLGAASAPFVRYGWTDLVVSGDGTGFVCAGLAFFLGLLASSGIVLAWALPKHEGGQALRESRGLQTVLWSLALFLATACFLAQLMINSWLPGYMATAH